MRRQISSKSSTCPEGMDVNAAGISVKVGVQYPGRFVDLPRATGTERGREGPTEVSRGHSRFADQAENLNVENGIGALNFDARGRRRRARWEAWCRWGR
jgi:hypothetical protein